MTRARSDHHGHGPAVAMLAVSAVVIVGLVAWGRKRALEGMAKDDPTAPRTIPGVPPQPIGPFPDLRVGTAILVDSAEASLPPPFNAIAQVPGVVDQILSDPLFVSATFGIKGQPLPLGFSGSVRRSAIVKVLSVPVPGTSI